MLLQAAYWSTTYTCLACKMLHRSVQLNGAAGQHILDACSCFWPIFFQVIIARMLMPHSRMYAASISGCDSRRRSPAGGMW